MTEQQAAPAPTPAPPDPAVVDGQLAWFDPWMVQPGRNARTDAEASVDADPAFVASIKAGDGNHTPARLVRTGEGGLVTDMGARRLFACRKAGTRLFGWVAATADDSKDGEISRLVRQFTENEDRLGMTARDKAGVVLALFELGVTPAGVHRKLSKRLSREEIAAAQAVAGDDAAAAAAQAHPDWTLDMIAVSAEFAGDPEATEALEAAGGDRGRFAHAAAEWRATAPERAQKRDLLENLGAGMRVLDSAPMWRRLDNLRTAEGEQLTAENHRDCPGRAVTLEQNWHWPPEAEAEYRRVNDIGPDDEIEFRDDADAEQAGYVLRWEVGHWLCADPDRHGHVYRVPGAPPDPTEAERAEAAARAREADRAKRAGNKQWYAATEVRTGFLRELLAAKAMPAGGQEFRIASTAAAGGDRALRDALDRGHELAADLLGHMGHPGGYGKLITELAGAATPKRALVIELAMHLAAYEKPCRDPHIWQNGGWPGQPGMTPRDGLPPAARYLRFLETAGYTLSDIERRVAWPGQPAPDGPPADVAPPAAEADTGHGTGGGA